MGGFSTLYGSVILKPKPLAHPDAPTIPFIPARLWNGVEEFHHSSNMVN